MSDILVLVEHHNNVVDAFSLQLLKRGRQLADQIRHRLPFSKR